MREWFQRVKCFADYTAYPNEEYRGHFKRGSHLSVQGQQHWSGEPHCASSYHQKPEENQCIMAPFDLHGAVDCLLSTTDPVSFIHPFTQMDLSAENFTILNIR